MGTDVDSMDGHHNVRECALDLFDAVGPPIAVVAIVDVGTDKLLRESRSPGTW
jgi:hypothetical protein